LEIEEFESAVGHGGLNILYSRGGSVFARFSVIVMEVWGAILLLKVLVIEELVGGLTVYLRGET